MNILIPWSGGLDSTYLVWKSLKEGHHVNTAYFTIINNHTKTSEMSKVEMKFQSATKKLIGHGKDKTII